jgi:hypothetical protein
MPNPYGAKQKMRQVARERGGQCLAERYVGIKQPEAWKCAKDHIWTATADSILNGGTWCPSCPYRSEQAVREIFERQTHRKSPKKETYLPIAVWNLTDVVKNSGLHSNIKACSIIRMCPISTETVPKIWKLKKSGMLAKSSCAGIR